MDDYVIENDRFAGNVVISKELDARITQNIHTKNLYSYCSSVKLI